MSALILNVDDYEPGRYRKSRVLANAGFDVREAATGEEGLQAATHLKPDLTCSMSACPTSTAWRSAGG